ncbi:MAG TPA: biotin-dependent carboxyltransferase family protein [Methylomirabilota bacterium]|nr:biotin-dependent carboxyltransferase family protein [Methylomirabilota bacterium]
MIHIEAAGFGSTVQDQGRFGHLRAGVPTSGPADPFAFRAAQSVVGNVAADAAIEIVGGSFAFRCDDSRLIAVTGRDVSVIVRDRVPAWTSAFVRAGDVVRVAGTARTRYAYVAISGGISTEPLLASHSAYPRAGLGRALRAGDVLPLGAARGGAEDAGHLVSFAYGDRAAAIAGPHLDRFDDAAVSAFFDAEFVASAQSDRQGARFDGPSIASRAGEILTCGVIDGAVQIPRGGQPIVLLADHQTTGGYPIIATVIEADIGLVAQRAPGETLRFYRVERDLALARGRALRDVLATA